MKKQCINGFALFLVIIILMGLSTALYANQNIHTFDSSNLKQGYVPNEIIIKFKKGAKDVDISNLKKDFNLLLRKKSQYGEFHVFHIPEGSRVESLLETLKDKEIIEYSEPNFYYTMTMFPNDPYYSYQWHLDNPDYGGINMEEAWDITTGSPVVIVAVLDTGVAYEDYREGPRRRFYEAPDLAETNFVPGYDFVNNDSHPNDDESHGTHVTGTIAQSTNNNLGVAGVAYNVSIMPVKVLDRNGDGTADMVADGILFAANNGADVINMSLGGPFPSVTLEDACAYAYNSGVTIVASSGNDGGPVGYPAAYDEFVIAVGATRYDETRAPYSNYGASLDLVAPGGDVSLDDNGDGYGDGVLQQTFNPNTKNPSDFGYWFFEGTSMAAPHVSGVAALLIANGVTGANGVNTPENVRNIMESTAEDLGDPGWDQYFGWGLVDAYAALSATNGEPPVAVAGGPYSGNEGSGILFDGSGSNDPDGVIVAYEWDFGDGATGTGITPTHTYADNGEYTVTLTVTDDTGKTGTDTANVTVDNVAPTAEAGGPYSGEEGAVITFTGNATDPGGDTLTYTWDFSDGATETGATVNHTFAQDGTYTATLTVTDDDGGVGTDTAEVTAADTDPVAAFSCLPESPAAGSPVQFTDESLSYDGITWSWDFGDSDTSMEQNPSHTYTAGGTYTVSLTIEEPDGDSDATTQSITVTEPNLPPIADAGPDQTANEGEIVNFDGSGSSDSDGSITSYGWDFGDGGSDTGITVSHVYADNGTYNVTLTVTDNNGAQETDTATVTINNVAPTVDAGADQTVNEGDTVSFSGSFSDPGSGDTHTIEWDFGDDTTASGTLTPTHVYVDDGIYTVTLRVTDDDVGIGTDTFTVTANNVAPTADAGGPYYGNPGEAITFAGSGTDPGFNDVLTYSWDFGDGSTDTGQTVSHTYAESGVYGVILTVKDDDGGIGTDATTATVASAPIAHTTIDMSIQSNPKKWRAIVEITVLDALGQPIVDATVQTEFSGVYIGSDSGTTNIDGMVIPKTGWISDPGTVTCTILEVSKEGIIYDLAGETSDSISN